MAKYKNIQTGAVIIPKSADAEKLIKNSDRYTPVVEAVPAPAKKAKGEKKSKKA